MIPYRGILLLLSFIICAILSGCKEDDGAWLLGHWPFDGSLNDLSGNGHHGSGEAVQFVQGRQGQALRAAGPPVEIPDSPDLQLAPGLMIDCWVYFDKRPTEYIPIVMKDMEYQLRVDHAREGGYFAFFVHLDGWEPRVRSIAPEAGQWYHVTAKWTGIELSLEVNGKKTSISRTATAKPTKNPVRVGNPNCRLDDLKIFNPSLVMMRQMEAMIRETPPDQRCRQTHFGEGAGWPGWRGGFDADVKIDGDSMAGRFPGRHALAFNPTLDMDVSDTAYLSVDLRCATARVAGILFLSDAGQGGATLPVWPGRRTSIVNLAHHPNWRGRLKLLAVSFPDGESHNATIENLWISDKPEGRPFLHVRSLAPGRAILRAGRDEKVIAIVRSLGADAAGVKAMLSVPSGVKIADSAEKTIGDMPYHCTERVEWTVRSDRPLTGDVKVVLSAAKFDGAEKELPLEFRPDLKLPKASYVPEPKPVKSKYLMLMHYCALWKEGTHYGWERIEPWPERTPAIGWYDEGTPEVADWHIKYALDHGIQGFIYCWYRADLKPTITHTLGHAIHDGLFKARYRDQFKFAIMWENGCAQGVKDRDDLMNNLLPYWMENYFKHPSYVKIDNKPLLYIWVPPRVHAQLGGPEGTRRAFDDMRAACRKQGFDGLYIVGCVGTADKRLLEDMGKAGWDASSAYAVWPDTEWPAMPEKPGCDVEGIATLSHRDASLGQRDVLLGKRAVGALPDIACVMMGWDPRPWHGPQTTSYQAGASPENFEAACRNAKQIVDSTPGNGLDKRIVIFDNWCEFGEGHYIEPCAGLGFKLVDVIREVFCDEKEPCVDVIPEDVGIEPPDRVYRKRREILKLGEVKRRDVVDHLLAWWTFDKDDDYLVLDSSKCGFHAAKQDFKTTDGIRGKGFLCDSGTASLQFHELLSPLKGITIELWLKTDAPNQSDRWIINTVGRSTTGYRLGMSGGRLAWQIPQKAWSHMVNSRDPIPLGKWTHVAATFDNKTMRVYVNGVEQGSGERFGAITPSHSRMCIGAFGPGGKEHNFIGVIDEIKIYDRALSSEEIGNHCRAQGR
ncbi:MAG: LamG-like jellyroll fold domain-containing protein [Planctomycetota bacterium]